MLDIVGLIFAFAMFVLYQVASRQADKFEERAVTAEVDADMLRIRVDRLNEKIKELEAKGGT